MQKQHSSPQRHRAHREGLIFSNREMPIGEKTRCYSLPSDLWHITIKQYHCSTMGCKGSLVLMVTEAFLSVGISRQTKITFASVIFVPLW